MYKYMKFLKAPPLPKKPSDKELIKLVQKRAERLGRPPKVSEFNHSDFAIKKYGNWHNFLCSAGLITPISDEQLIESAQELATKLGRPPQKREFEYGQLASRRAGNWKKFLVRAGIEAANYKQVITNEALIEMVQKLAGELDRTPRMKDFKYGVLATKRYGTWGNFIKSAGLERAKRMMKNKSNEELIELVQAKAAELGRPPAKKEFALGGLAVSRYGSWTNFLNTAGLESLQPYTKVNPEELIEMVQAKAAEMGRTPKTTEFEKVNSAIKKFGSWKKFLESAGLEYAKPAQKISNEELIELVQARAAELGRTPIMKEFQHAVLATSRYKKWSVFLSEAGLEPRITKLKIANEQLIELVQKQARALGRSPFKSEFEHGLLAVTRYGSWNQFLLSAGLEPGLDIRKLKNEDLIRLVQERTAELGRTPIETEFYYSRAAINRYGSWENFLHSAGLDPIGFKHLSDEDLIAMIQEQAAENGWIPKQKEFKYNGLAIRRFNTWDNFLMKAGLDKKEIKRLRRAQRAEQSGPLISDKELIRLVREQAVELGRIPEAKEFEFVEKAEHRYSSWESFLIEAGLSPLKLYKS